MTLYSCTLLLQGSVAADLRGGGSFNSDFVSQFISEFNSENNLENQSTLAEVIINTKRSTFLRCGVLTDSQILLLSPRRTG